MRLAEFILRDMDDILHEWDGFARAQRPAADQMGAAALRNHAADILRAVVGDIERAAAPKTEGVRAVASDTATRMHAVLRARAGFDINQLCAEFRALRASVLRLWSERYPPTRSDFPDVMRFNDAIDHALAESVEYFERQVDQSRNLLLGALGHDLRNPLDTIQITALYLAKVGTTEEVTRAAQRLRTSAGRMKSLLDDLLDYNRSALGVGIRVARREIDLAATVDVELQQLRVANPAWPIELETHGDTRGTWDPHRMQQLVGNLVSNAVKYGDDAPVRVRVRAGDVRTTLEVRNRGPRITADELSQLFEPLKRGADAQAGPHSTSLGLGLYIAREIVRAHGGHLEAHHVDGETAFVASFAKPLAGSGISIDTAIGTEAHRPAFPGGGHADLKLSEAGHPPPRQSED